MSHTGLVVAAAHAVCRGSDSAGRDHSDQSALPPHSSVPLFLRRITARSFCSPHCSMHAFVCVCACCSFSVVAPVCVVVQWWLERAAEGDGHGGSTFSPGWSVQLRAFRADPLLHTQRDERGPEREREKRGRARATGTPPQKLVRDNTQRRCSVLCDHHSPIRSDRPGPPLHSIGARPHPRSMSMLLSQQPTASHHLFSTNKRHPSN